MTQPGITVRNLEIDRLRALAVIMTMFAHLDFIYLGGGQWYHVARNYLEGGSGVVLFFVISGFVISKTLVGELDSAPSKYSAWLAFMVKRTTRIMPMAILWILIPLCLSWSFNERGIFNDFHENIYGALAALLYYFNFYSSLVTTASTYGVYWSLSLEEQFYLVFPVFLLLVKGSRKRLVCLAAAAVLIVFIPPILRPALRYEGIVYGVMLYLVAPKGLRLPSPAKWAGIGITLMLSAILMTGPRYGSWLPEEVVYQIPALTSVVLVALAVSNVGFVPALSERLGMVADWIGTRSFGIYLIHLTAYQFAGALVFNMHYLDHSLPRFIIAIACLIVAAEFCYRFIETPIRDWGRAKADEIAHGTGKASPELAAATA